jgi:hypothetical protein
MPAQRRGSTADARMPVHGDSSDGRNGPGMLAELT